MVQISSAQYEHIEKSMDNQKISDGSHSISLPQNHLKKKNSDEEKQIIQRSNVLYRKRRRITDFSLAMIISGLIFMITDNQLVWKNIIDRVSETLLTL